MSAVLEEAKSSLVWFAPSKVQTEDLVEKKFVEIVTPFREKVYKECISPILNALDSEDSFNIILKSLALFSHEQRDFREKLFENPDVIEYMHQVLEEEIPLSSLGNKAPRQSWERFFSATIKITNKALLASQKELENINKHVGAELHAGQLTAELLLLCYMEAEGCSKHAREYLNKQLVYAVNQYCRFVDSTIARWDILGKFENISMWKGRPVLREEDLEKISCPFPPEPEWQEKWQE